ncbi:MAG: DUF6503 family protein [Bacteroidota bacterium]
MRMLSFFLLTLGLLACGPKPEKTPPIHSAQDLIQQSIAYHDADGHWQEFTSAIEINSVITRRGGSKDERTTGLSFDNQQGVFQIRSSTNGIDFTAEANPDSCFINFARVLSGEDSAQMKSVLGCAGVSRYKDYYTYLIGLPMKLSDPEAIVQDSIMERSYGGKTYDVVKVNYEPLDTEPAWYFYFDQESHAFALCKFTSKDDENKGGEYILYNQETVVDGMKLFKQIVWLYNPEQDTLAVENLRFE